MERDRSRRGMAMVAVLLVLMALFVLCAPFLVTVRNADQASSEAADRSVLRMTLDAEARHATAQLGASHPAIDATPYADDEQELAVSSTFPKDFLPTTDPHQVMWGLEAEDVAARIDLASAPPQVFANLIGGATRLAELCKDKDTSIEVSGTEGFLAEGVVLVDNEWMSYAELGPTKLGKLTRGLLVKLDDKGKPADCGPTPALPHEVGAFVLDQRAFALCEWRTAPNLAGGKLRTYEGIEQLRDAKEFMLGPELGREAYLALEGTTSCFGHVRAGAVWQRPVRVVGEAQGEPQYGCKLPVDDLRWFNPGTTVWITDGEHDEYALVRATENGMLVFTEPLRTPFKAYETIAYPLARTPVNVNTARPDVLKALWTNLKLRGKSARITAGEAEKLVDLALVSRPFSGFEDFLRRFVLPAGGLDELPADAPIRPDALVELARDSKVDSQGKKVLTGFIDPDDARALYKNALNANDNELEFATMPLCFTSRDVYALDLRAAVNAPSGTDRARGQRELVELVVPQRDLLSIWTRQEDFDEAPRLDLAASGWLTGPMPTSRYDALYGEVESMRWPTRARAHLGPYDTQYRPMAAMDSGGDATMPYVFAVRSDEDGWAQLAPYREQDQARKASYALHFDDETKDLEGRFLPDQTAELDLAKLCWSGDGNRMSGMAASLWIKPRELTEGARLLDIGGRFNDTDRVSLLFEGGNLVLRVLDGAGDHPTSSFKEQSDVYFPLSGEGPGLPLDTWSHVQIAVDGNRPDQMSLWVDGRQAEHTPGLTRLTSALPEQSDTIVVESTEGFPDKCVLRIGNELIEAIKKSNTKFIAKFQSTGEAAGFGGRIAREEVSGYPETSLGLPKFTDHPAGSSVQLYGYSTPIFSNVPNVASNLSENLEMFAVARVTGILLNGSERTGSGMEPIVVQGTYGPADAGHGFDAKGDEVTGLLLDSADPKRSLEQTMQTFSTKGGYAAILALSFGTTEDPWLDINGARIGGIELIHYTGVDGNRLMFDQRGGANLKRVGPNTDPEVSGRKSFIITYSTAQTDSEAWLNLDKVLSAQVMVIPISIPARTPQGVTGFEQGNNGSAFVQITQTGADSHLTEWVRYDEIGPDGSFVRDDPNALIEAGIAAHGGVITEDPPPPPTRGGGNMMLPPPRVVTKSARLAPASAPAAKQDSHAGGAYWDYLIGEEEDKDFPVARATNTHLQFRGVLGTFGHRHPSGTLVLPVFRLRNFDETSGWPGRFDQVMFMSEQLNEPGFPGVVMHAHRPNQYLAYSWRDGGGDTFNPVGVDPPEPLGQAGFQSSLTHVALDDRLAVPFVPSPVNDADGNPVDTRLPTRMVLFPSGELPREVTKGQLGGDAVAGTKPRLGVTQSGGGIPAVTVDEALFFPSTLGNFSGMPVQFIVAGAIGENDKTLTVLKEMLRTPLGDYPLDKPVDPKATPPAKKNKTPDVIGEVLANLPKNGGLLRIGDELLCYESFDTTGNTYSFALPPGGRGVLGTHPEPHRPTESVSFIGAFPVGILARKVRADEALLPLVEVPANLPSQGLVRIEDELVHYARVDKGLLIMPRASSEPGKMDDKGPGLFRGRFGTEAAEHAADTPVILFPFRYWDRWHELADAPELTYYELSSEQPDAYWKRVFWKASSPAAPGAELGVLQRTNQDTPWDAAPENDKGLRLMWEGKLEGEGNPIGVQSDRIEWRVFVRYLPGAFDPLTGLSHGWKTTPRLELFGVEFMGPNRTYARVDR